MISLKQSLSDLDRLESLNRVSRDCYCAAIEAAGRYPVEVEKDTTQEFSSGLLALVQRIKKARSSEELVETRSAFQGQLQDYAEKAGGYVRAMQERLGETTRTLRGIVEAINKTDVTQERKLDSGVKRLSALAKLPEIRSVCPDFEMLAAELEDGITAMRQKDRVVIAQLQGEIESLQDALQSARQKATKDPITGALNRAEMLDRIRRQLDAGEPFCLLFLLIGNFGYVERRYGGQCRDSVIAGFAERLRGTQQSSTPIGRWADDRFVVLLERAKPEVIWMTESLLEKLTGPYVVKDQDLVREIKVQLRTGVVESPGRNTESRLLSAVDKMLSAIETVDTAM